MYKFYKTSANLQLFSGIGCISNPSLNSSLDINKPYTAYDLSGRSISNINSAKGVVIVKQNGMTFKLIKK